MHVDVGMRYEGRNTSSSSKLKNLDKERKLTTYPEEGDEPESRPSSCCYPPLDQPVGSIGKVYR
jgi:hypothetical protein